MAKLTKAELLADLKGLTFVSSLIGVAKLTRTEDLEDDEGNPFTVKWYEQNFWEVQGKAAVKRTINFYVEDEDGTNECAFYKDAEPQPTTRRNSFDNWLSIQLYGLVISGEIASWTVKKLSENVNHALVIFAMPGVDDKLDYRAFLCIQSPKDGTLVKTEFNLPSSELVRIVVASSDSI